MAGRNTPELPTTAESGEDTNEDSLVTQDNTNVFLSLPDVVKDRLLTQLASFGLGQLLKLRLLCKETKSWVDTSPARTAKMLFSKAQVNLDFNVKTIERFLETPPPFYIPRLCLKITKLRDISELGLTPEERLIFPYTAPLTLNPPAGVVPDDSFEMWTDFCDYWNSRLDSLRIGKKFRTENIGPKTNNEVAHIIRRLLDSPLLDKVTFSYGYCHWKCVPPFPTSFHKLSEIFLAPGLEENFYRPLYPNLEQNPNLKRLSLEFYYPFQFEFIHKIVEKNRNNSQFQLCLTNENDFNEHDPDLMPRFSTLVMTLVKCDFRTFLTLELEDINGFLEELSDQLGAGDYYKCLNFFYNLTLNFFFTEPLREDEEWPLTLVTWENFENLKILTMEDNPLGTELRFPPNLVELTYGQGFPSIGNLPLCLKELTLDYLLTGFEEFETSMAALSSHCVNLEKLEIIWFCEDNEKAKQTSTSKRVKKASNGDFITAIKFRALKSLSLKGYSQNREMVRELFLTRLELDQMSLVHLVLSFHSLEMWRPFCDGNEEQIKFPAEPEIFRIDDDCLHARIEDLNFHERLFANGEQRDVCPIHHVNHSCVRHNMLDLIDGDILTRMCDGPIGKSLLFLEIPKETVSLDGFPALQKLKGIVCGNLKNKLELEGRGRWFYDYPVHYDYYTG